jgi:type I restriction enzyme R subunit
MADVTHTAFASPNFAFLMQYDEVLVRHAALAERYIFDDPNAALLKLRQFGELLAQHAAACTGVAVEEHASQRELIDKLWDHQIINAQVSQLFHGLRKSGNAAAHQHTGDRREALHKLQMARKLAVWFHKSFGGNTRFQAGPFVPPPNPREIEGDLRTELERLRAALAASQDQIAGSQQLVAQHAQQRHEAEAAVQRAYDDLAAALALATETEQQLEHERQQFQQRLAELQSQIAAAPAEQRAAVAALAQHEAEALDLDEAQTRRSASGSNASASNWSKRSWWIARPSTAASSRPWAGINALTEFFRDSSTLSSRTLPRPCGRPRRKHTGSTLWHFWKMMWISTELLP